MNLTLEEESELEIEGLISQYSCYFDPESKLACLTTLNKLREYFLNKLAQQEREADV
jgi:hypothetical protein